MEQAPGSALGAAAAGPGGTTAGQARPEENGQAVLGPGSTAGPGVASWRATAAAGRWPFQLALLACYLAAGIAATWPRASYLTGRLPPGSDQGEYVWNMWWIAHQVVHLGNPWFTGTLAAPVGVQLGFDTLTPLLGLVMTPVTLLFGPSASYSLLVIVTPGLACYAMWRAARLWLRSPAGAIAAGAFFGLSGMFAFQDWYHLHTAAGCVFLPLALEAAVLLRRDTSIRRGVILGLVLGASMLVDQELSVLAVILAAGVLIPWLVRRPGAVAYRSTAAGAVTGVVVASPQLITMVQALAAGHSEPGTAQYVKFAAQLPSLFAPSPAGALRADRPREHLPAAHRDRGARHVRRSADRARGARPGGELAAPRRPGLRRAVAGLRRAGPRPHPVPGEPPVHPACPDLARAAGIAADAGHLADPAARAVLVPRAGPAGAARPGRGRHPGRGGGGVAGPAQPPCADRSRRARRVRGGLAGTTGHDAHGAPGGRPADSGGPFRLDRGRCAVRDPWHPVVREGNLAARARPGHRGWPSARGLLYILGAAPHPGRYPRSRLLHRAGRRPGGQAHLRRAHRRRAAGRGGAAYRLAAGLDEALDDAAPQAAPPLALRRDLPVPRRDGLPARLPGRRCQGLPARIAPAAPSAQART